MDNISNASVVPKEMFPRSFTSRRKKRSNGGENDRAHQDGWWGLQWWSGHTEGQNTDSSKDWFTCIKKSISELILAIPERPHCTALNLQWRLRTVMFPPLTVLSSIYCKQSTALVFLSLSGSVNKPLRFIYTERKWTRKPMCFSNFCLCSM